MDDRKLAIITPLIILVILVAFTQTQIAPIWINTHRSSLESSLPDVAGLQLLGYNFNKDLVQISLTLWNKGSTPIVMTAVYYDNLKLIEGVIGSPTDPSAPMYPMGQGNLSITSNDIIFPASDHWNMLTGGGTLPMIQPNGIVTLYLGVSSTMPGSTHVLILVAGTQEYAFELQR